MVLRGSGPYATTGVDLNGCSDAQLTVGRRRPIQLSHTFPGAIGDIDRAILAALGLPVSYGR